MPDETAEHPNPVGAKSDAALPYPDEVIFAPPRRAVVPRRVYRRRRIKALYALIAGLMRYWSVGRLVVGLFCVFAFGLIGVAIADAIFCPEGTGARFWEGCLYETIGFGVGGGLLGFAIFLFAVRIFDRRPSPLRGSTPDPDNPG